MNKFCIRCGGKIEVRSRGIAYDSNTGEPLNDVTWQCTNDCSHTYENGYRLRCEKGPIKAGFWNWLFRNRKCKYCNSNYYEPDFF